MSGSCLYCIEQLYTIASCTSSCLTNSNIQPTYPGSILFGSVFLSIAFLLLSFFYRNNLKKFIGFRIASIAFLTAAIFTIGLIFNGHFILKNLPIVIPLVAGGSYLLSYFLSFYFIRISHKLIPLEVKSFHRFVSKISRKIGINTPNVYVFFSNEPKAFAVDGFKKGIFISDSLVEKLDKNSIKAVLLHELYHLKKGTGVLKNFLSSIATLNFRIIPVPINQLERYEEEEIDKILLDKYKVDMNKIKTKLWG